MDQIRIKLDQTLGVFESGLNVAGYVPLVSTISGALRVNYGKLEIIGAVAAAGIIAVKALFAGTEQYNEFNHAVEILFTYASHGAANVVRGIIEIFPFVSLATCLPYDLLGHRYSYPFENAASHTPDQSLLLS